MGISSVRPRMLLPVSVAGANAHRPKIALLSIISIFSPLLSLIFSVCIIITISYRSSDLPALNVQIPALRSLLGLPCEVSSDDNRFFAVDQLLFCRI